MLEQISEECTPPSLSTRISNLLQPAQAEVVLGQLSMYLASLVQPVATCVKNSVCDLWSTLIIVSRLGAEMSVPTVFPSCLGQIECEVHCILQGHQKNIKIFLEEAATCRRHKNFTQKPVLRRVLPLAKDNYR
jgi:hypothetical protein